MGVFYNEMHSKKSARIFVLGGSNASLHQSRREKFSLMIMLVCAWPIEFVDC